MLKEKQVTVHTIGQGGAYASVPSEWIGHMVRIHRYEREVKKLSNGGARIHVPQSIAGQTLTVRVTTIL